MALRRRRKDARVQPIRNHHTDPGAARPSSYAGGGLDTWPGTNNTGTQLRAVDAPWSRSGKAMRITWAVVADANSGGVNVRVADAMDSPGLWTFTAYIYASAGLTQGGASIAQMGGGGTFVPGSFGWERVSGTVDTPSVFRVWGNVEVTNPALFAESARVHLQLNGKTTGSVAELSMVDVYPGAYDPNRKWGWGDDFGWRWDGPQSVGYPRSPLLIRNRHSMPVPTSFGALPIGGTGWSPRWYGNGGAGVTTLHGGGGPGGRGYARKTWATIGTSMNDIGWTIANRLPVSEMPPYLLAWMRLSTPGLQTIGRFIRFRIEYYDAAGVQVNASAAQSQVGTRGWEANQWVSLGGPAPAPGTLPAGAATFTINLEVYTPFGEVGPGFFIDATMAMLGDEESVYCDGYTPGWRWLGTPGASASEGYPYTLEGVAGGPIDGRLAGAGGLDMPGRPDPLRGMAFYTVYDVVNADGQYQEIGSMGHGSSVAEGRFTIQSSAAGNPTMNPRVDFKGGESNRTTTPPGSRTPGRHILSVRVPDGMQAMRARVDGGHSLCGHASGLNPGQGIAETRLRATVAASLVPRDTVGIQRDIDDLTDLAIHRWLANTHGIDTFRRIAGAPVVDIVNPVPGTTIDIPTGPLTIILVGRQAGDTSVSPGYWEIANNSTGGWVGALADRRRRLLAGGVSPGNLRQDVMRADDGAVWNIPQGQASQLAVISTTVNDAGMRTRYNLLPEVANEPTTPALATPMNVTKMRVGVRDGGTQAGTDLRRLSIWPGVLDLATREALVREVAFMHQISL